jgi:CheY-like chemotaxis protein
MESSQEPASFMRDLRWALQHLYDTDQLRQSPLLALFSLVPSGSPSNLRDVLLDAIEVLKPASSLPPQHRAWRIYGSLYHRYVDQFAQREVARALDLSVRQLRRQEHLAMRVLAEALWARYGLDGRTLVDGDGKSGDQLAPSGHGEPPSREQELRWLEQSLASEPVAVTEIVDAVLATIGPLLQALKVTVERAWPERLPHLVVQRATARQALLNVLTAAVRAVPGGRVTLAAEAQGRQLSLRINPFKQRLAAETLAEDYAESLDMARRLAVLSGGSLLVAKEASPEQPFAAQLILPCAPQVAMLVVDDNADTLQLFERYLASTPYSFVGTREPQQTVALAEELHPQVIVLDVMLPDVDGWELLGRLREDPATSDIPVIVCTILPEEQLALALGAAGFVRKPVSRSEFLAMVEQQLERRQRSFA